MTNARDARIIEQVASLAQQSLGQITEAELDQGWLRLASRLAQGQHLDPPISLRPRYPWVGWALAGTAALAVGIAAYRLPLGPSDKPLHCIVEGATVGPGETIAATSPARVLFSDESRVGIEPLSKIRVLGTDAHGAHVAIADGSIDVFVKPRKDSSWRFEAGPFSVLVKGTAFRLGFEAAKGRLDLHVKNGVVDVRGPREDRVLTLRGGESMELFVNPPREAPIAVPAQVATTQPPSTLPEIPQAGRTAARHAVHGGPSRLAMHDGVSHSRSCKTRKGAAWTSPWLAALPWISLPWRMRPATPGSTKRPARPCWPCARASPEVIVRKMPPFSWAAFPKSAPRRRMLP
jgi:ferric-dicitrate binding protein FerR (iron transport regulator)